VPQVAAAGVQRCPFYPAAAVVVQPALEELINTFVSNGR
jgi:hypothetical protein